MSAEHGDILQIVDEEQGFASGLSDAIGNWGLADAGFNYHLLSVFGSQSTGKSTLLNRVFGTGFQVMNETERRQTTKGIWMSKGLDMPVLVMDVEGTDGRERGEDQDFERKSALFSMASAEVLVVNLWEHQIGLYQGANMGLLKTVMEVNLSLFQASSAHQAKSQDKTLLLFIIRDFIGSTPLENLRNTLTVDLEKLWDGLSKPKGLENARISDYFDMEFDTLPHKLLQPDLFDSRVVELRQRFADPSASNYVFKPLYHKRIPADGVSAYMSNIWQQILSNKDLDLPTQQELLAQFRCDEIAVAVTAVFEAAVAPHRQPVASGTHIPQLGSLMGAARSTALKDFDHSASRYAAPVYQRKRAELLDKLNASLNLLFVGQLKNLHKVVVRDFKKQLEDGLKGEKYDFGLVVRVATAKAEATYRGEAKALLLSETDWSFEQSLQELRDDLSTIADVSRSEETKKMVNTIEKSLKRQISEPVNLALNKPSEDMWDRILLAYRDALGRATTVYSDKAAGFNCTEEENSAALAMLRTKAWIALRAKINEQTTDATMLVKLKLAFEDRFRYDEAGVPRVWKPTDDLDALYKVAKDETLAFIPLFSNIAPKDSSLLPDLEGLSDLEEDDTPSFQIFTDTQVADLANRFRREADAYYIEAKRSLVSSISQVPLWIYGVMAFLGWNEFLTVIRSPIYFTVLTLSLGVCYVIYSLGMGSSAVRVVEAGVNQAIEIAREQLRVFVTPQQPIPNRPHSTRPREEVELEERKSQ